MYSVILYIMFYTASRNHSRVHRPAARVEAMQRVVRVPSHEEIARLAYSYWEAGGRREGTALEDWLRAEKQLGGPIAAW